MAKHVADIIKGPKPKRGRPKKLKQADIPLEGPGVAHVHIQEVEDAADAYADARDRRMKLTEGEVEAKRYLITVLKAHSGEIGKHPDTGEIRYVYDGGEKAKRVVVLKPVDEKLKVKDVEEFEDVDVT